MKGLPKEATELVLDRLKNRLDLLAAEIVEEVVAQRTGLQVGDVERSFRLTGSDQVDEFREWLRDDLDEAVRNQIAECEIELDANDEIRARADLLIEQRAEATGDR